MKKHKLQYAILLLVIIALYVIFTTSDTIQGFISNPETLKTLILGFGILAPIAIIVLQAFQSTISIIPSQITTIVAGFIFGPIVGLIYSLIGSFIGSAFVFKLSRKYGSKLALKFLDKKELAHFKVFFKQQKIWALFLARITPIFPNDVVSFAAGLTKIKERNFHIISTLGFIVQMVLLAYFGAELAKGVVSTSLITISVVMSVLFVIVLFKKQIKKTIIKDYHKVEKELKDIEDSFQNNIGIL